ncbi:helix-turn-helix domain-containing protein [Pseudomonas thivervalensis]|uniref:AraC-like ligand-binding domain-containing protein n=1 Tax=Pseudomonas thivervalensis TaxID=86265 RepID=UPI00069ED2E8|nr:helix-turn-helix domain-containing protein [Pseudomonas thivervalensis]
MHADPVRGVATAQLSTLDIPPGQRLGYWRDMICGPVVPLEFELLDRKPLDASLSWWEIGDLRLSQIEASPHRVRRSPARAGMDSLVLDFVLEGHCYIEQDGRRVGIGPGSGAICNAARPYIQYFPETCKLAVLTFPRELLSRQVAAIDRGTATDLGNGSQLFPLLSAYVKQLITQAPSLTPTTTQVVAQHLSDLICGAIGETLSQVPLPLSEHKVATLIRVHAYVSAHLHESSLNPEAVANALRVSTRYINQLLEAEGVSLGRLILRKRLEAVADALRDPNMTTRSISTLALAFGFNDLTHFSKTFRQQHGVSAREYRAQEPMQRPR